MPAIDSAEAAPAKAPAEAPARVIFGRALDLDGQAPVRGQIQVFRPGALRSAPNKTAGASASTSALASQPMTMRAARSPGITSSFGMRQHPILGGWRAHLGVDMAAPAGSPVLSPDTGTVRAAGWHGGYGLMVTLEHSNGMVTRYAHLSRLNVAAGQRIGKGAVLGFVGSTGRSTGPHLHYETWVNGQPVNPLGR